MGKERPMEESFPMNGGNGHYSYIKNSYRQKNAVERAKSMLLRGVIENLDIEQASSSVFTIADLGCSTGPNTFIAVENIVEGVTQKYKTKSNSNLPEFQGRIHYANAPNEVGEAYSDQYAMDMESFLAARAEEIAPGGLMAMIIPGRPDGTLPSQFSLSHLFCLIEYSLIDMVNEGLVSKDKLDMFNLPMYSPSVEELRALVEKNGYFSFAEMEIHETSIPLPPAGVCRAGLESFVCKHFGTEITEQIFDRYSAKFAELPQGTAAHCSSISLFILLKRRRI
ncbi:hypothetical protein GH714_022320 [Hevea brasiliensis]|uniref:S-adenosylmethionine-dependent methyltransferase n=1 Tax=Hevea brasiliensis TaxID=3981 RepID=A0A6A6MUA4_HEVBR|nr:hypothetical protein GH714_022320 [Hevea brasiliensis]